MNSLSLAMDQFCYSHQTEIRQKGFYLIPERSLWAFSPPPQQKPESWSLADRDAVAAPGLQEAVWTDDTPSAGTSYSRPGNTEENVHEKGQISEVKWKCHRSQHVIRWFRTGAHECNDRWSQSPLVFCDLENNQNPVVPEQALWLTAIP